MKEAGRSRRKQKNGGPAGFLTALACLLVCFLIFLVVRELLPSAVLPFFSIRKPSETQVTLSNIQAPSSSFTPGTPEESSILTSQPPEAADLQEEDPADPGAPLEFFVAVTETTEAETEPPEPSTEPLPTEPVTLLFAGDILFDDHYAIMASMLQRSGGTPDIATAFDAAALRRMQDADIFMLNNEFPYTDRGTPTPEKQYTFRAKPAYASLLKDMGADIVALANNHMYDYGEVSLTDTLDTLDALGLPYTGAGRNLTEAEAPVYLEAGNIKIGFISATQIERMGNPDTKGATDTTPGVFRCLDSKRLISVIGEMKENCDFVVCYLHWGTESTEVVDDYQKKLAKEAAAAGADLIIGDHPHVLQGLTAVDGVPVIYSMANYLFNSKAQDTCLLEAKLDPVTAELKSLEFIPCRQEGCRTKILTGEEKSRVIAWMRTQSKVSLDDDGFITWR